MRSAFFIVLLLCVGLMAKSQDFEVPQNYQLKVNGDFEKYRPDLLKAIDWFERTPYNQERLKKRETATFIMTWIQGYHFVRVNTSEDINRLGNKNYDLLVMYIAGYARYVLNSRMLGINKTEAGMAGMKALLARYEKDKAFIKDRNVERLVKLDQKGELQAWLSEELIDKNYNQ